VKREAVVGERVLSVEVAGAGPRYTVTLEGRAMEVEWSDGASGLASLVIDGASVEAGAVARDGGYSVLVKGHMVDVTLRDAAPPGAPLARAGAGGPARVTAPMPGRLVKVLVQEGDSVSEGQGLVVMEAMKMENELRAESAGRVTAVRVAAGEAVERDQVLIDLAAEDEP